MARRDNPPELLYKEKISGSGRLIRGDGVVHVTRYVLAKPRYDVEAEWEFRAFLDDYVPWNVLFASGRGVLSFWGTDDRGQIVTIPVIHCRRQSGREFEGTAQTVTTGTPQIEADCVSQNIRIDLWPTALATPEVLYPIRSWTGEIKTTRAMQPAAASNVSVRIAGHRLRFSEHYDWDECIVSGRRSTVRIPTTTLSGSVRAQRRSGSVESLCDALESDLEDLTRLLSLLSRRHVRWSRIEVTTSWRQGEALGYDSYCRMRGSPSSHRMRETVPLLVPGRMPDNWLELLLSNYRSLVSKEGVAAAIIYLIVARDSAFVDTSVANAHTAFEASLNALSDAAAAFSLPGAAFEKLASKVRSVVREFSMSARIPAPAMNALIRKVPELRRRPIVERAMDYIARTTIDTSGLWPAEIPLAEALAAMFHRRNRFIHAGLLGEVHQASIDAARLTELTERLLLGALGVREEWLHPFAISDSAYLATVPEPAGD